MAYNHLGSGSSHPELALAYLNMGGLEYQRSNFPLAESYCQRALEIQLKTVAETDPRVIDTLEALAKISDELGNSRKAREYRARANATRSMY